MGKKNLYFDCFSGISGDMTVGALLDLGIDSKDFLDKLNGLNIKGYHIEIKKGLKKGIAGTDFNVVIEDGKLSQPHRNINDIYKIIEESGLNENIKNLSRKIFRIIAEAEAFVHRKKVEEIHFHEIGAIDSIIDIVGSAICFDALNADEIISSPLNLGGGFVDCEHGRLPVPAPATVEILKGVPVYSSGIQKELTTPTGAAIIKAVCSSFEDFPAMEIERSGYGLGKRDLETPNALRVVLGKKKNASKKNISIQHPSLWVLETNIDDMNPEIYSYILPKLFDLGSLDVYITPIIMKKNRPANMLSVLCPEDKIQAIEKFLFMETTTLGIRKYGVERSELDRKIVRVATPYGEISVKAAYLDGKLIKFSPEYEDCAKAAENSGLPFQTIYTQAMEAAKGIITSP